MLQRTELYRTNDWTRSEVLLLSNMSCSNCFGLGKVRIDAITDAPCNCVLRNIFRRCYSRYKEIEEGKSNIRSSTFKINSLNTHRIRCYSFKNLEYSADFVLVAKKSLKPIDYSIFEYFFLQERTWIYCSRKVGMHRGEFWHHVYRIEKILGTVFRSLRPFPLYPVDEYFNEIPLVHPLDRNN